MVDVTSRSKKSLMSPTLLHNPKSKIAVVHGYPQNPQDGGVSQEDDWKNVKVVRRIVGPRGSLSSSACVTFLPEGVMVGLQNFAWAPN